MNYIITSLEAIFVIRVSKHINFVSFLLLIHFRSLTIFLSGYHTQNETPNLISQHNHYKHQRFICCIILTTPNFDQTIFFRIKFNILILSKGKEIEVANFQRYNKRNTLSARNQCLFHSHSHSHGLTNGYVLLIFLYHISIFVSKYEHFIDSSFCAAINPLLLAITLSSPNCRVAFNSTYNFSHRLSSINKRKMKTPIKIRKKVS